MELVAPNSARELFLLCGGSTLGYLPFSLRQGAASPKKGGAFIHVTTLFGMRVGLPTLRKVFFKLSPRGDTDPPLKPGSDARPVKEPKI